MNEEPQLPYIREAFYRRERRSVPRAREFARCALKDWDVPERADDVALCVSELATNALLHGVPPGRGFRLCLSQRPDGTVRVEVHDSGDGEVRLPGAGREAEDGRGLHLVAAFADRWGVGERQPGKIVWCEFEGSRPQAQAAGGKIAPMAETPPDGAETLAFEDLAGLDSWLERHHELQAGLWVKVAKKGSGLASVTAAEVNDAALCFGWITGQRKGLDGTHYLQKITPRRSRSQWSQVNVRRVAELTAAGRMRAPGLAEVAAAKADGRWGAAYASQKEATVPEDLAAALDANPVARRAYEKLGKTDAYQIVLPLLLARTEKVRAARLQRAIATLTEDA